MTSVSTTPLNAHPDERPSAGDEELLASYLNWNKSHHSLEFTSRSHEYFSHQLQNSAHLVIGLCGLDSSDPHATDAQASQRADAVSIESLPSGDLALDSFLTSNCNSILLKRHCDKIIMSTALVKNRGEKQLFLATDFLRCDDPKSGTTQMAPLVLYPVQLFYNDHTVDGVDNFLLYSDSEGALENTLLTEKICEKLNLSLPTFVAHRQQDFLLSIAVALESHPEYSLCKRILFNVLQTGADNSGAKPAKRYRRAADRQLNKPFALGLLKNRSIPELHTLLDVLEHDRETLFAVERPNALLNDDLKRHASLLTTFALGNLSLRHVMALPEKIELWTLAIENLRDTVLMKEFASDSPAFYAGLGDSLSLLETPPSEIAEHFHPDHAYKNSLATLQRAKFQCRLIVAELDALKSIFNLESIPDLHELQSLCEILESNGRTAGAVVETNYFHARKKLSSLLCSGSNNYGQNEELQLKRLVKILRLRELFSNNNEYRLAFGKLFVGMRTNWALLEAHIVFAGRIAKHTGSETLTSHILEHWSLFSLSILEIASDIHIAARAVKRLLQLLQIPAGNEPDIDELLDMARQLKPRLEEIRRQAKPDVTVAGLTSQGILDVMALLDEIRNQYRSDPTNSEHETFKESVFATLGWMRNAMRQENIKIQDLEILVKRVPS